MRLWQKVNSLVKGFKVYDRKFKSNKTDRQTEITRLYIVIERKHSRIEIDIYREREGGRRETEIDS